MNLLVVGCSHHTAPVEVRERLALPESGIAPVLAELLARFGGESLILSTCNRLEVYASSDLPLDFGSLADFVAENRNVSPADLRGHLYEHRGAKAVRHLFRVAASLDSLIVGEGQIAGQVKRAYDLAQHSSAAGPLLHAVMQHARVVARRVRRETGISHGHASVSSVAVDYVRQVFSHFDDKTVLVIGAGKMGRLTLKHLQSLVPKRILVTNRSPERASEVAAQCGGEAIEWRRLHDALAIADIVLSTTGSPEHLMTAKQFTKVLARRAGGPMVILDIAVPRDFDPAIHDGDRVCLFNIDDLQLIREKTLADRKRHVPAAESIVEQETTRFVNQWMRRRNGPTIAQLTSDFDQKRQAVVSQLMCKLNGRLTDAEKKSIEGAFRLLQNQFLHGPISALGETSDHEKGSTLLEALKQLFRLGNS